MRNAKPDSEVSCKAAIAAYQRSLALESAQPTRFELEDAYAKLAAIEVLNNSKADPLLLGNAALLTRNLRESKRQFDESASEGNNVAKQILSEMTRTIDRSKLSSMPLTKDQMPGRDRHGWKPVLYWLPVDTELLVQGVPSSNPTKEASHELMFGPLITEKSPGMYVTPEGLANNKIFENCKMAFVLHGARVFDFPGGLGLGHSQSADVIVFGDESRGIASTAMERLRKQSTLNQIVEGVEVLSFEEAPFSFARCAGGGGRNAQYLCSPCDGVLIAANEFSFLRELLFRMKNCSTNRALSDDLPEWKLVDQNADLIIVRHYDRSFVPFDFVGMYDIVTVLRHPATDENKPPDALQVNKEIGLVISRAGRNWTIKHLSNNSETLKGLLKTWQYVIRYEEGKLKSNSEFKSSLDNSILTIEATPDEHSPMSLQLLLTMGYFVAI
jgi:hypothetical protein